MRPYQNARTVPTTERNVSSHKSRRREIRRKGKLVRTGWLLLMLTCVSAKYIEGLENRLGRMESLLKMSGLLTEEEAGRTDLGTLEKRLADKASSTAAKAESPKPVTSGGSSTNNAGESQRNTPNQEGHSSPPESATTPGTDPKEKRDDVENLSEMMCSLVSNNVGETRYIGKSLVRLEPFNADSYRLKFCFQHLQLQGY